MNCPIKHQLLVAKICPVCGKEAPKEGEIKFHTRQKFKHGFSVIVSGVGVNFPLLYFDKGEVDLGIYDTIEECERMIAEYIKEGDKLIQSIKVAFSTPEHRELMDLIRYEIEIEEKVRIKW